MDPKNKAIEKSNQSDLGSNNHPKTGEGNYKYPVSIPLPLPEGDSAIKSSNSVLMNLNNQSHLNFMRNSQDQNYSDVSLYQGVQAITNPQNYLFKNQPPSPHLQNEPTLTVPNNFNTVRMPTAQVISDSTHIQKATSPHPSQSPQLSMSHQQNQGMHIPFMAQQGFPMNHPIHNNTSFQQHGQMVQGQMMQMTHNQGQSGNLSQNYMSQGNSVAEQQIIRGGNTPSAPTPLNSSNHSAQDVGNAHPLSFIVQPPNQNNNPLFQLKNDQTHDINSTSHISNPQLSNQMPNQLSSNNSATPVNMVPHIIQPQTNIQYEHMNFQSKISLVVNQITQIQANLSSLTNINNPQAAQIYQFLTNRLQQFRTLYCQLVMQQQQQAQQQQQMQRNFIPMVQGSVSGQMTNNPVSIAMYQQQISAQNQMPQSVQLNPIIPRANLIQNPYQVRMNQPMQSQPMMMPPGLARFQGPRPPFMSQGQHFMMQPGHMRTSFQMEPSRGRRGYRGTRRRRKFSSESEEEEELTSSDNESTSQMTPSGISAEDMELRRSSRRQTHKSYMQDYPDDSDGEKNKKESESLSGKAQDLIPFQPTEQIEGKLMLVEKILADRIRPIEDEDELSVSIDGEVIEEFYVKFKFFSYLHCEWCNPADLKKRDRNALSKIKRYKIRKRDSPFLYLDEDPFNPDYVEIDRIFDVKTTRDPSNSEQQITCYLIKWCALPYDESTWEFEDVVDEASVKQFYLRNTFPSQELLTYKQKPNTYQWQKISQSPLYKNDNVLREYQLEGINWLIYEYYVGTNCILADEMGLGKTIQSIAFLIEVRRLGIRGPFLIIAPLSTIGNWYREFRSWSDFNVVVFHGAASSRNIIHRYELYYRNENGDIIPDVCKFEVLVTTYEMILSENKFLSSIRWRVAIVDEAHRLKNRKCKLLGNLSNIFIEHRVLLTGTPLQNTLDELLSLLNFLDPSRANALEAVIQQNSGRLESNIQVQQIQAFLKPVILRRLKEDVEKNIAPKEETIIEVEMTSIQKKVYRGILERNLTFLIKGTSSTNLPSLMNVMMELRKCCNHPFLNNGVEEKIFAEYSSANPEMDRQTIFRKALVESSGKLVLVDKLLPKLRDSGHKMLIFSQMVRVLDLIEEYLVANNFLFERIDGSVRGNLRQAAIDRFSKPDSDRSVFLLCTKAGGLGINLTAADTVIIFDSDWNPQNDIQAQARCHRIGQNKTVKVYRLICRKTYEREMFDRASLKLGLDKAVLHDMNTSNMDSQGQFTPTRAQLTKKEVEKLIREGAYANIMDEDTEASAQFCSEDIDQILERRATVIRIAGEAKGSTFAKASFNAEISGEQVDIDDPDFWAKWAKSAKVNVENDKDFIGDQPRIRKQVCSFGADSDVEFSDLVQEHGTNRRVPAPQSIRNSWLKKECLRVEKYLLIYGWRRWPDILKFGNFKSNMTLHDIEQISKTILVICWQIVKTSDTSFTDFVEKAIRLTTLRHRHDEFDIEDINYRPYGKRTRNRKSRDNRKKSEKLKLCLVQTTSDWKNLDVDALVFDQNYKKHLQHCASKILIRLRLLFYIEYYILRDCKDDVLLGVHIEDIIVPIVPTSQNTLTLPSWWDCVCDKSLIVGTFKYGYEKYELMTTDKQLCYSKHIGLESKSSCESSEAVVKRRGRKKKVPAPMLSDDDNAIETELFNEHDTIAEMQSFDAGKLNDMPSHSDLNTYVKRLVMSYWKNRSKTHGKVEGRIVDIKSKWTRKEEADFYRALTTYGIEHDSNHNIIWQNFRKIGKFDRKDDQLLSSYLENLIARSDAIISTHAKTILNGNIDEGPPTVTDGYLTHEKAEKILQRIELFDLIRKALLAPKFPDILKSAPQCIELPDWWNFQSDLDLLTASSMFGIDPNDKRIFVEESLSFHKIVQSFHATFLTSHEFVAGISDVANPKDLSIEMIKSIIHWPKIKIILNRIYGLSMLAIHSTWCDKYQSESASRSIITKTPIIVSHLLSPCKQFLTTSTHLVDGTITYMLTLETTIDKSSFNYNSEYLKEEIINRKEQMQINKNKVE